jgi:ribosomal protein S18 acetylase RimI-like enzyme
VSLEIRGLDLGEPRTVEAIVALQRASYRVEAELLGARTLPALTETPRQLRAAGERFLGAFEGERLVGAVAWKRTGPLVDVHRLVVHPDRFRRGIGGRLLDALDEHEADAERVVVATGAANAPARRLYERHGFAPVAERLVGGAIPIVTYERRTAPGPRAPA